MVTCSRPPFSAFCLSPGSKISPSNTKKRLNPWENHLLLLVGFANKHRRLTSTSHTLIINRSEVIKKKPLDDEIPWQVKILLLLLLSRDTEEKNAWENCVDFREIFRLLFTCRPHERSGVGKLPLEMSWEWFNWRGALASMWDSCLDQSSCHVNRSHIPTKRTLKFYFRTQNEEMFHLILHARRVTPNAPVTKRESKRIIGRLLVTACDERKKSAKRETFQRDVNMWQVGKSF